MTPEIKVYIKTENNSDTSIQHITGVQTDFAALVVTPRKKYLYITSLEEKPRGDFEVRDFKGKNIFEEIIKRNPKTVGVVFEDISAGMLKRIKKELKGIKLLDISKEDTQSKAIKSKKEIIYLQKAVTITEEIFSDCFKAFALNKFKTENEVIVFLKKKCIDYEVEWSFEPIVASGSHAKIPHYFPKKNTPLQKGFCIIDFGVKYKGYCADMTRTLYLGTPSKKEVDFYNSIRQGLHDTEQTLRAGAKLEMPFEMIHALGHGIGLHVHEAPNLHKDILEENMALAIEPAKYSPYGVRIENNYVILKNKYKKLSKLTTELQIISFKSGKR